MAAALAADTVAQRLRDAPTRAAALDSLERHAAPIPTAVAMCAAPALFELLTMDEPDIDRSAFDRAVPKGADQGPPHAASPGARADRHGL